MLQRIVAVERHEVGVLLASFAYFFCLLCGYYILRPVRDEMGITDKLQNLPWLFKSRVHHDASIKPILADW